VLRLSRVFVYDFASSPVEVTENKGVILGAVDAPRGTNEYERNVEVAGEVQKRLAEELVAGIRDLGLPAERVKRGTPLPANAIGIWDSFLNVSTGDQLRRAAIGFGAGQ
jgi:hypothetical protein